jgi:hypothetical protein
VVTKVRLSVVCDNTRQLYIRENQVAIIFAMYTKQVNINLSLFPAVFLIGFEPVQIAVQAKPIMTAHRLAACGASPDPFLLLEKILHTVGFYVSQIVYHAHVVFLPIPGIQRLETLARKIRALGAEPHLAGAHFFALVPHKRTVLPPGNASGAVPP